MSSSEIFRPYTPSESSDYLALKFYDIMKKRRSVRHFSNTPICETTLALCLQTAAQAPSGANSQPWHFAWIRSPELRSKIRTAAEKVEYDFYHRKAPARWLEDLAPFSTNERKPYLTDAPALVAIFSRIQTDAPDSKSYYPLESVGIATGILMSALQQCGLSCLTHTPKPMGFLNEILNLDKSYRPFLILAIGYPAPDCQVPTIKRKHFYQVTQIY